MNTQGQRRFRNILLAGLPGVGKSTFGRAYAQMSRTEFVELDKYVERLAGKSISDIFAQDGEGAFRALEAQCLERLLRRQRCTIALGGGTLTHPQSLALARELGCIVLLTAPLDDVVERLWPQKDSRPLMSGCTTKEQLKQRLHELLIQREESYAAADVVLDTTHSSVDTLKIELSWLERHLLNRATKLLESGEQRDGQSAEQPTRRIPLADPSYRSPREQRTSKDMVEKMERLIKSQSQRGKERGDKKDRSDKRDRSERRDKSPNQNQQQQVQAAGQNPKGSPRQRPRPNEGATQGPVPARQSDGQNQGPVPARQSDGQNQGPVPARQSDGQNQGPVPARRADGGGAGPVPRNQNSNPKAQLPHPKPQRNSAASEQSGPRRPEKPDPAPRD